MRNKKVEIKISESLCEKMQQHFHENAQAYMNAHFESRLITPKTKITQEKLFALHTERLIAIGIENDNDETRRRKEEYDILKAIFNSIDIKLIDKMVNKGMSELKKSPYTMLKLKRDGVLDTLLFLEKLFNDVQKQSKKNKK